VYANRTRKEEFSGHVENCQQNASDLEGSLVMSSRPPGRPQKRPDDRTSNSDDAAQAADDSGRTVGAGMWPFAMVNNKQCGKDEVFSVFQDLRDSEANNTQDSTVSSLSKDRAFIKFS